ncbi:lipopolysaccharide biosynthesis protein [Agrobacterium tumefaciens]|uniref:lipopolysaccharide biosynthesis protein n=1 Tax=Agrobacterium tumefaciens TaxID=358 RepID=UPI00384DEFA0
MLLRQTFRYLPAQVMSPLIQMATILVWAHLLPAGDVGVLTLVVAIQEISFGFFYMWWTQYTLRRFTAIRSAGSGDAYLRTETAISAFLILAQLVILFPVISLYFGDQIDAYTQISVALMIISRSLTMFLSERYRAESKVLPYTAIQIFVPAFAIVSGALLCLVWKNSVFAMALAFTAAQFGGVVISLITGKLFRQPGWPDGQMLVEALKFGVPIMLASLLAIVANNGPRFIVDRYLGLEAAGMFAIAYGLGLRVASFASMMVTAGAYPLVVARMEKEGLEAAYLQLRQNTVLLLLVLIPAGIGLITINRSVVEILLPAHFAAIAFLVLPLSALTGIMRDVRNHTTNQVFLLQAKTAYATGLSAVDITLSLLFAVMGIMTWGAAGAVAGPLVATCVTLALSATITRVKFAFKFPVFDLIKITCAAALMSGVVSIFPVTSNPMHLGAQILLGGLTYGAVVVMAFWKDLSLRRRSMSSGNLPTTAE